jgi:hypothetical protein
MKGQAWQDAVVPVTVLYAGEIAEAGLVVLHFRREEEFRGDLEGACRDVLIGVRRMDDVRFGGREGEIVAGVEMLCLHLYASYRRMRMSVVFVIIMACTRGLIADISVGYVFASMSRWCISKFGCVTMAKAVPRARCRLADEVAKWLVHARVVIEAGKADG